MDGGREAITDADELVAVRLQARRVVLKSLAWTALAGIVLALLG